jgi:hypothetical protein
MLYAALLQTGNTKRVKCLLFSPMCSKPHLVPVPVRKVRGGFSTIADVFYRVHVNIYAPDNSTYYVSDNIVLNGIMPMSAGVEEPFSYTVFRSNHVCALTSSNRHPPYPFLSLAF